MSLARAGRARRVAMLTVSAVSIAVLAGCSTDHPTSRTQPPVDPDTAACSAGARTVAGLHDTFTDLSDQLGGIGPASQRGDTADVQRRVSAGAGLAEQISTSLHTITVSMNSAAARQAFNGVADAGDQLRTALVQLGQAVAGQTPAQGVVDSVQQSLDALNTSVGTMKLSCSTEFAESTVARTPAAVANR